MIRLSSLMAAALLSSVAYAEDPYQGEGDNSFGPYETNASLTKGALSGFTSLFASAESLQEGLKPGAALTGTGTQILAIENTSLSSVTVTVSGTKVGTLGPVTIGRIQGLDAGSYTVVLGHPNGYNQTLSLVTASQDGTPASAAPSVPAAEGDESTSNAENDSD